MLELYSLNTGASVWRVCLGSISAKILFSMQIVPKKTHHGIKTRACLLEYEFNCYNCSSKARGVVFFLTDVHPQHSNTPTLQTFESLWFYFAPSTPLVVLWRSRAWIRGLYKVRIMWAIVWSLPFSILRSWENILMSLWQGQREKITFCCWYRRQRMTFVWDECMGCSMLAHLCSWSEIHSSVVLSSLIYRWLLSVEWMIW